MAEPLAVDIGQASVLLGVSETVLKSMVAQRLVPSYKLGGRRLFDIEALRQWSTERALASLNEDAQPHQPRLSVQEGGGRATGRRSR